MLREITKTGLGKLFLALWGAALFAFVGICLVGIVDRELAGAAAFAILVAGALINASIVISYWTGPASYSIARMSWIALAAVALLSVQVLLSAGNNDADIVMAYGIAVLSFPLGLLAGPLAEWKIPSGMGGTALLWAVGVAIGYLQWFVLLPSFIRTVKRDRQTNH